MTDEYNTDNPNVSRQVGKSKIPVQGDNEQVQDPVDANQADTEAQLDRHKSDAIDKSKIINECTRHAKPQGRYRELGDGEGVPVDLAAAARLGPVALSECPPPVLRQHPDYSDDPPTYNKEELLYDAKSRERKIIFIRLLTSIFITVIVSLTVAAVVEKIHNHRRPGGVHKVPTPGWSAERITIAPNPATSVAADAAEATAEVTSLVAETTPSLDV
ncbi:hypothetical protein HIM_10239 [Hirsutella minnesotensis 3608]|uniref:Uncharacterized protein n=1 Tax=Hirsutella minnesotensis 3608 TaxID=1043627 RepID=A0A0F7ZG69_9HYPO|nr:hypothetical protein HIM_10239 [Hirsutella minnesotensis 3608]